MVDRKLLQGFGLAACVASTFVFVGRSSADILPGSIWPNGTLETPSTTQLNAPACGTTTWRRGGADFNTPNPPATATTDFWDNVAGTVSGTHALRINDTNASGNGEWFVPDFDADAGFVPVTPGGTYRFRFFWNYSTSAPTGVAADMRVTIRGTDGTTGNQGGFGLGNQFDFLANGTTGNQFVVADFTRTLPASVVGIRMNIASGGGGEVTGFLAVDDISVVAVPEPTSAIALVGAAGMLIRRRRSA